MATVTVACAFMNGIVLQCWEMVDGVEGSPNGPRTVKVARRFGPAITINGPRHFRGLDAQAPPHPVPPMQGKFALTHNVDAELWERWLAANADLDLVKNGLVWAFSSDKKDHVVGKAKDHKAARTGFEPLDPANFKTDPRVPHGLAGRVSEIETAPEGNQPRPAE